LFVDSSPGLKVPRQGPLVLFVEVSLRKGKAEGSENVLGYGRCCDQRRGVTLACVRERIDKEERQ
jgi:hypothetical protein